MERVRVADLKPGMALSQAIHSPRGDLLLRANVRLSERHIAHLRNLGCATVYVADGAAQLSIADVVASGVRQRATSELGKIYGGVEAAVAGAAPGTALAPGDEAVKQIAARIDGTAVERGLTLVLDELLAGEILVGMNAARANDGSPLVRALDVTAVAIAVARRVGYRGDELRRLARGCLLKDVGMILADPSDWTRDGHFTAEQRARMRLHARLGYELLAQLRPHDLIANHIAYQHHERQDGTGYPRGLHGTNKAHRYLDERPPDGGILLDAEIAAVADAYVSLSGGRSYRRPLSPQQTINALWRRSGTHLNRQVVAHLLGMVPVMPLGASVMVTTGRFRGYRGIVSRVRPDRMEQPIVRLLRDDDDRSIAPTELDVSETGDRVAATTQSPVLREAVRRRLNEARASVPLRAATASADRRVAAAKLAAATIAIARHRQMLA